MPVFDVLRRFSENSASGYGSSPGSSEDDEEEDEEGGRSEESCGDLSEQDAKAKPQERTAARRADKRRMVCHFLFSLFGRLSAPFSGADIMIA